MFFIKLGVLSTIVVLLINIIPIYIFVNNGNRFDTNVYKETCDVELDKFSCHLEVTCKSMNPILTCRPYEGSYCSDTSKQKPFTDEFYVNHNSRSCSLGSGDTALWLLLGTINIIIVSSMWAILCCVHHMPKRSEIQEIQPLSTELSSIESTDT